MVSERESFSSSIVSWLKEFSRLSTGQENGDDNDPSYKMMEQFNRDLMERQGFFFDIWTLTQGQFSSNSAPIFA